MYLKFTEKLSVISATTIPTTEACEFPSFIKKVPLIGKPVKQSSTNKKVGGVAERAIDGNYNTDLKKGKSCTQTNKELEPWWRVDLEESHDIYKIEITNRMDCCSFRIKNAEIRVGDNPNWKKNPVCGNWILGKRSRQEKITVKCGCEVPMTGRYVSIQLKEKTQMLHLCEVDVFAG
ncbi:fucolectin-like [Glandiceps talaboti]